MGGRLVTGARTWATAPAPARTVTSTSGMGWPALENTVPEIEPRPFGEGDVEAGDASGRARCRRSWSRCRSRAWRTLMAYVAGAGRPVRAKVPTGPVGAVTVEMVFVPLSAVTVAAPTGPLGIGDAPAHCAAAADQGDVLPVSWSPSFDSTQLVWLPCRPWRTRLW